MIRPEQWSAPWTTDDRCTRHQSALAEKDLADWLAGKPHVAFDAFRKLVEPISKKAAFSLREIGCGAGYYLPIFRSFVKGGIYQGIDISTSMIAYARDKYRDIDGTIFRVGDAEHIGIVDACVDCVCLAAVIQHMPDYRPAIKESVRVSKRFVLIHRVEATTGPTFEYENPAYGTSLPTRIINEQELLTFCGLVGLTLRLREEWGGSLTRFNCSLLFEKT